jgi:hypothetical protein
VKAGDGIGIPVLIGPLALILGDLQSLLGQGFLRAQAQAQVVRNADDGPHQRQRRHSTDEQ